MARSLASPGPEAEAAAARHAKAMAADLARPHGRLEAALVPWFAEAFGLAVRQGGKSRHKHVHFHSNIIRV